MRNPALNIASKLFLLSVNFRRLFSYYYIGMCRMTGNGVVFRPVCLDEI